ncbi:hypothetical protein QDZ16_000095 [Pluralibacter gergoviae]|nr:hypothetical protein [Klebsiella sp. RHBSTW-00465]EKV6245202.1 hypothetical protein [Pluralibacter gergoviae]MBA7844155.1 hypothetical protein [Klebsiella sp. RHBSTW-00465]HBY4013112.1 hypothetical protein [Klebsiella pneumoniae]
MAEVVIRNEDDAYALLERIVDKNINAEKLNIEFEGWPNLYVRLKGEQFESTITPTIMKAFIELQAGIHRAYATAAYGTPNAAKLTKSERQMLEIVVKVEPGSSIFTIDFQEMFEKVCGDLIGKMDGTQTLIAIICFALLYFGNSAYKNRLQTRKEIRSEEIKSEEQKALLDNMRFAQEQETERARIMANVAATNPRVHTIEALAQNTQAELLKRSATADSIEIQDIQLTGRQAEELAKNARKPVIDIRLDGLYRILSVDSTDPDGFKVKVRSRASGDEFIAVVQDETLDRAYKQALQRGEWQKKPVELIINAKQRTSDDSIYAAKIIKANLPESPDNKV